MTPRLESIALALVFVLGSATMNSASTLVDQLIAGYETIQSVSCDVRRDAESSGNKVRALSRVFFEKPDKLHVDNVTPLPRRIICDGVTFFSFLEGDPKGYSRPVSKLENDMLISLRKVPATAMDHLLRLRGMAETNLEATSTYPVRKGYDTGKMFAVLSLDTSNRLTRIEMFTSADLKQLIARMDYGNFVEAVPGVWLAALHQSSMWLGGKESKETSRFDHLTINQPIAQDLFKASLYFKGIEFVSSFEQMYP
ncbi:MAG: hypothetical protein WCS52_06010 [bacterium]